MMKRTMANGGAVLHDPAAPKEHYVTVSKAPNTDTTKVVWHVDPSALVGPREEEMRRKAPEGKVLYAISAILTILVLWGIFRHAHFVIPRMFSGFGADTLEESITLDQIDRADSLAADLGSGAGGRREGAKHLLEFDFDASGIIGGRRIAKHLLEIASGEPFLVDPQVHWRVGHLHKVWDTHQEQVDAIRSGGHGMVH